eukprot:3582554-Alexandrium_andersonii.AAC.1
MRVCRATVPPHACWLAFGRMRTALALAHAGVRCGGVDTEPRCSGHTKAVNDPSRSRQKHGKAVKRCHPSEPLASVSFALWCSPLDLAAMDASDSFWHQPLSSIAI